MALLKKEHYELLKIPIVSTMHGTWLGERSTLKYKQFSWSLESVNDLAIKWLSPRFDKYEDYAIKYSNAVVVESKSECNAISKRNIKNLYNRIIRLPPGVDTETFNPSWNNPNYREQFGIPSDSKVILHVGRLAARKGVYEVLHSFSKVFSTNPKARLLVTGTGPLLNKLKKLSKSLKLDQNVIFTGKVPFETLRMLYASCDVFVMHTYWEGFGLTNMEALASGTPCISTNVGGAPEFIEPGKNGYLVDVGDIDKMAEYIVKLLDDDELHAKMKLVARASMETKYKWQDIVDKFIKLYEQVLEDPKNEKNLPRIGDECF
jgi:glycosyltransferase involved in cell wall biosynthesis